ncbi:MAG: pre-peptidase C-terminal domain-containing protein [Terracidiphilus sp.]
MKSLKLYSLVVICALAGQVASGLAATLTPGQTVAGTISSAAQANVYTFTATAGNVVDLTMTTTSGNLAPRIRLYNPIGTLIGSVSAYDCNAGPQELNTIQLTATGTYTVDVSDCASTNTGNYALYMQLVNSPGGASNLPFNQTESGTIGSAAQSNTYTFSATANQVIDFTITPTSGSPKIRLYNPDGTLDSQVIAYDCNAGPQELNTVTLPTTGAYTVLVGYCGDTNTGSYEIYAQLTDGLIGVPLLFGQTQPGTIDTAAQSNTYTFSANAGDVVDFTVTPSSGSPKIRLYNPDGTLNSQVIAYDCNAGPQELNTSILPTTGTYTVLVGYCGDTNTGDYELYSQRTNNPTGAVALPPGETQAGLIGSAAQSNTYTFSASAGNVVDFTITPTSGSPKIRLYNPDGTLNSQVIAYDCNAGPQELNTSTLPTTGTYTVLVGYCGDTNTGNYTIYSQLTNNPFGAAQIDWDQVQAGVINSAAQSNTYTFVGNASDVVDFTVTPASGSPKIRLYNPDGTLNSQVIAYACDAGPQELNNATLPTTGNYTVLVGYCGDTNTGNYNLSSQCFGTCPLPAPTLASISPTSVQAGSGGLTLTVNGTNFVNIAANSVVQWNGSDLATTWVSTTQMTAVVPASDTACGGVFPVTVFTPAPGGGTSSAISFTVNNPVPAITPPLSPASALAGSPAFTLTINGSNFVTCSAVEWNGNALATTFVSATQLQAAVPASDIQTAGTASVSVFNSTPIGGASAAQTFTIDNPLPAPTSLSPTSVAWGGAGFTLTVNGNNFVQTSTINWNGSGLPTNYVSSTQLTAAVPGSDCTAVGMDQVTVTNPAPGGGTSAPALTFNCVNPVPVTIAPLSPASVLMGSSGFTLTVNGSNFIPASTVIWKGAPLSTTYVSSTQLTAAVPTADLTNAGYFAITVLNALPGPVSNAQTFLVDFPQPVATSLSPPVVDVGSAFTLVVNGSNFFQNSKVLWNGIALATSYMSATELQATVPATDTATPGTAEVTVFNSTPGGGTSSPALPVVIEGPQPVLTSPACGSVLPAGGVTFNWIGSYGAASYDLWLGTSGPGSSSLYTSGVTASTSATVPSMPARAATVYARLYWTLGKVTQHVDCTYTEAGAPAMITSPAPGKTLGTSNVTFTWTAGYGVTEYNLWLGTSGPGSSGLYSSGWGTATSATVTSLPAKGVTVYARLYSMVDGVEHYNDYTYTETAAGAPATMMTPMQGSTLGTSGVMFTWTKGTGATQYNLWLGLSGPGSSNLYTSGWSAATTVTVPSLPGKGATVYARLYSDVNGVTEYNDYTYIEQ